MYFYNNGNIHLNYDDQLLFDLQKREEVDLHCLQRCDRIKNLLLKNPLRYTREELNKPAFFISENAKFYLYHKEWMALDLEDRYFSELASQGIDPDEVHAVFTHVSEASMNIQERESLGQHIKRRVLRKKDLTILTTRPEIPIHLIKLFPGGEKTGGSPVKPVLLEDGTKWDHADMNAEVLKENLLIRFGNDNTIFVPFGNENAVPVNEKGWHVSADRKTLTWKNAEGSETELKTLRGYPLVLEKSLPSKEKLIPKYLGFLHSYLEAWEGRDTWEKLYSLEDVISTILENGKDGGDLSFPADPVTPGLEYLYLCNALTLLEQLEAGASGIQLKLQNYLGRWDKPSTLLPVLGDLYHGEKGPFILYRISTHKLNPHNFRKAEEISRQMIDLEIPDLEFFKKERKRLLDLIESLYGVQSAFPERSLPPRKTATPAASRPVPEKTSPVPAVLLQEQILLSEQQNPVQGHAFPVLQLPAIRLPQSREASGL